MPRGSRGWLVFAACVAVALIAGALLAPRPSTGPSVPPRAVKPPVAGPTRAPPSGATWVRAGAVANPGWSFDGDWLSWELSGPGPDELAVEVAAIDDGIGDKPHPIGGFDGGRTFGAVWHPADDRAFVLHAAPGAAMRPSWIAPGSAASTPWLADSAVKGVVVDPAFAADGDRVAFISYETGDGDLRVWHRATDTVDPAVITPAIESTPAWSPDGTRIAVGRAVGGDDDVAVLDVAAGAYATVAAGPGSQIRPTWGADGSVVYFDSPDGERWSVVAKLGDVARTVATDVRLPVRAAPALTPDRAWLAWTDGQGDSDLVHLTNLVDGRIVDVATGLKVAAEPAIGETTDHRRWLASVGIQDGARVLAVREITAAFVEPSAAEHAAP